MSNIYERKKYLSANTLFHFTNNIENIINILKNEFSPRYCMESFKVLGGNEVEAAIPMVCFCDIPLAQIRNHIEHYGGYAIGLSKEWGISQGINPVMYSNKESISTKTFRKLVDDIDFLAKEKEASKVKGKLSDLRLLVQQLIFYMKPYEGQAWNESEFNGEDTRFYDEREWRYIPDYFFLKKNNIDWWLDKDSFLDDDIRTKSNKRIGEVLKLSFDLDDIKYVVVNSDKEILRLCNEIDMIKGDKYTQNEITILKTRIISKEQILSDF